MSTAPAPPHSGSAHAPDPGPDGGGRASRVVLAAILVGGACLRVVGLDFGLPLLHARPDESLLLRIAMGFGTGDLNPHSFHYGTLWPYALFVAYGAFLVLGLVTGRFEGVGDLIALYDFDPSPLIWIGRALSASAGTVTLWCVARAGSVLVDRSTGLCAAALLGVTYLHVRDSHFATTDVPMTALLCAGLLCLALALDRGRLRDYVWAGVFAGLAASTKYAGAFLLPAALWMHGVRLRREGGTLAAVPDRRLVALGAAFALAFLAGTPFALLDSASFVRDVLAESRHLLEGHHVDLPRGWWQHPTVSLRYGMGLPLLGLGVIGLGGLVWRRPAAGVLLVAFPLVYCLTLAAGRTVFVRYAIPLLPFLCVGAAFAVGGLARAVARRVGPGLEPWLRVALCALLAVPSLARVAAFDRVLLARDNRLVVQAWVEANLPPGSRLAQLAPGGFMQGPQWARVPLSPAPDPLEAALEGLVASGRSERRLRVWLERLRAERGPVFEEVFYAARAERFETVLGEPCEPPAYLLVASHPIRRLGEPSTLPQGYRLVRRFEATRPDDDAVFDHQDAFFVPYAGFGATERPGPNYALYAYAPAGG